jgi:hypothetical protein
MPNRNSVRVVWVSIASIFARNCHATTEILRPTCRHPIGALCSISYSSIRCYNDDFRVITLYTDGIGTLIIHYTIQQNQEIPIRLGTGIAASARAIEDDVSIGLNLVYGLFDLLEECITLHVVSPAVYWLMITHPIALWHP